MTVHMNEIIGMAEGASDVFDQVREQVLAPFPIKTAPTFASPYIAELCKIDRSQMRNLAEKHNLPVGTKIPGSKAKSFSLNEVYAWVRELGGYPKRPENKRGRIISVVNYKGGVTKTLTCVSLAQALTLRGQRVLLVPLDGQGSATQLCGYNPEDIGIEETIMPFIDELQHDLRYAIKKSYWENLDVIPECSALHGAEFSLPLKAMKQKGFRFWEVLRDGLEPFKDEYDVIMLDTSPSLSHLTMNAMFAGDALIMPCPPESLDFASSIQFWSVFTELAKQFPGADQKEFDFVSIILTKVKSRGSNQLVKTWMRQAYGDFLNPIEIPDSEAAVQVAAQLKTIFDLSKREGNAETFRRYKEPFDRLADYVVDQLAVAWSTK